LVYNVVLGDENVRENQFVEIREYKDLERAIEFAWNATQRCKRGGYPEEVWKYEGIKEYFTKAFNPKDDKVLVL